MSIDLDQDYWEILGESYGYPADLIKQVYDSWDPREHRNFGDFVAELKEEIATGVGAVD